MIRRAPQPESGRQAPLHEPSWVRRPAGRAAAEMVAAVVTTVAVCCLAALVVGGLVAQVFQWTGVTSGRRISVGLAAGTSAFALGFATVPRILREVARSSRRPTPDAGS
jgi:putative effector of murein hydrolase